MGFLLRIYVAQDPDVAAWEKPQGSKIRSALQAHRKVGYRFLGKQDGLRGNATERFPQRVCFRCDFVVGLAATAA